MFQQPGREGAVRRLQQVQQPQSSGGGSRHLLVSGPAEGERRGRITQAWKRQGREAALRETGVEAVGFHPLDLEGGRH